ncbi:recombinase family protein [bacterium]
MKLAAIYTRVSSDRQKEDHTIDSQVNALKEYASEQGYKIPDEWYFKDDGYSGAYLNRPGLERLRDLTSEGQIEKVLIYSPDRLSRKYAYQVLLIEEFNRAGAEIIFIKSPKANTPEEELLLQFQGMIAEYERAQIVERSRRGKKHQAKMGNVNVLSRAPYGYRYNKKTEYNNASYEIVEEQAEVVRRVFEAYSEEGKSILGIARWLNQEGVSTSTGKGKWLPRTVAQLLKNPAYKGQAAFGRHESIRDVKSKRNRWRGKPAKGYLTRERPESEWISVPVLPIISKETFELARERLSKNKHFSTRNTKINTLLQGLLVCESCGYAIYRVSGPKYNRKGEKLHYYRCSRSERWRMGVEKVCSNRPIRQDYLDELVWSEVMKLLENPEIVRAEINKKAKRAQETAPIQIRKDKLIKEQIRIKKGMDKLLDAYQEDLLPLSELRERMPDLRKRETTLKVELESLEMKFLNQQQQLDFADNLEGFLKNLGQSANNLNLEERQKILRLIVKEVLVSPEGITIKHCIPITNSYKEQNIENYQLYTNRQCCYS